MTDRRTFICNHCGNKCVVSMMDCYDKLDTCLLDNEVVSWEETGTSIEALTRQISKE